MAGCNAHQFPLKPKSMNERTRIIHPEPSLSSLHGTASSAQQVPIKSINKQDYVSIDKVAQATGYTGKWLKNGSYGMGDYDIIWSFQAGESSVKKEESQIQMPAPAVKEGNELYIPVDGLGLVLGEDVKFETHKGNDVTFVPDTSNGPAAADGNGPPFSGTENSLSGTSGVHSTSMDSASADNILKLGQKYLGVKYDFGAEPYSSGGTFDCSSFTQYLFSKAANVDLPRTAREQAKLGDSVSQKDLRKGDLVFFAVPGRFKSSRTVGHVGVYMGNGEMLNSCPKPKDGVQITNINKPYWQNTFITAKRLL